MTLPIVVLDTCVLYPGSLRDTLLTAVENELFVPRWTEMILEEFTRNLIQNGEGTASQVQRLLAAMQMAFPDALILEDYRALIDSMTNHPKDRHVLAATVASDATGIVTFNIRDFPPSSLAPWEITIQTPNEFLLSLLERDAEKVKMSLVKQAKALNHPPKTLDEVLDTLALHAPTFVDRIRSPNVSQ